MDTAAENIIFLKATKKDNLFIKILEEQRLIIVKAKEGKFGKEIGTDVSFVLRT